jgi:signal transduction histidine kinase
MDYRRVGAAGAVSLSGFATGLVPLHALVTAVESPSGVALAGLGVVLAIGVVTTGALSYRSSLETAGVLRVCGWCLLGLVAFGAVMALVQRYLRADLPLFIVADVLLLSAAVHLLIGYTDVRRIRADELADRNQRLAVLSGVFRHNLRTDAQVLMGHASLVGSAESVAAARESAEQLKQRAGRLTKLNDWADDVYWALEFDEADARAVPVVPPVSLVAAEYDSRATVVTEIDCPADTTVVAGPRLRHALAAVVEEAIEASPDGRPEVGIGVTLTDDGDVRFSVSTPNGRLAGERPLRMGSSEARPPQSGLRLWVAKWVTEAYGGRFSVVAPDAVRLEFTAGD